MQESDLVTALKENNSKKVNKIIKGLRPRLVAFLRIHMNASIADAEDCAHDSLITSINVIREDKLEKPEQVVSYILTVCRNNYLKMIKKRREQSLEDVSEPQLQAPKQLQTILAEEQQRILEQCLDKLKDKYRRFMEYWFKFPDAHTEKVADHFGISVNNAWTRKHRLIKKLNECYREKINL